MNNRMNKYLDKISKALGYFREEKKLYRFTYPLNFVESIEENDILERNGIVESIEKEIRSIFFIYYKIFGLYNKFRENDDLHRQMIKSDVEYFFIRYRILYDIIDKHLTKAIGIRKKDICTSICNNQDFLMLRNIRNKIIHESTRCHIFFDEDIDEISFQIYDTGTLNNNIYMDEIFLNPKGSETYYLKYYMTWMIVNMIIFLDDYFQEIKSIRTRDKIMCKDIENQIKEFDKMNCENLSYIHFFLDDFEYVRDGINQLKKHVEKNKNVYIIR